MCAHMLIHATAQRGYTDTVWESALEADWEKNALPHRLAFHQTLNQPRTICNTHARDTRMHAKRVCENA